MNYSKYKLSELFDKIDKLLQSYFGKEDDYNFYEKVFQLSIIIMSDF